MAAGHQEAFRAAPVKLVAPAPLWRQLREVVRGDGIESAGVALASIARNGADVRLLLKDVMLPASSDYLRRDAMEAVLSPSYVATAIQVARARRMSSVFFHTHPWTDDPKFSEVDSDGERVLSSFVSRRVPDMPHVALVLGRSGHAARLLGVENSNVSVTIVGSEVLTHVPGVEKASATSDETFDRQVRVFGVDAQRRLQALRIGIVGLGGTGSIVAEQLAHLGIVDFVLIDPDVIDASNLNRVAGASQSDCGRSKVAVAANMIDRIGNRARVSALRRSVVENDAIKSLLSVDAVFCCTDSHGSRFVLNELAYRHLIPCFDCGVVIVVGAAGITHISARVQMLAPGLSCLTCSSVLDPEQVRRDLMTDFERARDPYVQGGGAPAPAVMSLNGAAVSLAVTMFLGAFCRVPVVSRHQRYDAMKGTVRNIDSSPYPHCVTCSAGGGLAVGDSWPLPGRLP